MNPKADSLLTADWIQTRLSYTPTSFKIFNATMLHLIANNAHWTAVNLHTNGKLFSLHHFHSRTNVTKYQTWIYYIQRMHAYVHMQKLTTKSSSTHSLIHGWEWVLLLTSTSQKFLKEPPPPLYITGLSIKGHDRILESKPHETQCRWS